MITRNDVAKRANVSPAVVSYVINNSNYVSQEKREAVLKAIDELGYFPNALARSLKSGKSNQILLLTDDIRSEIFSEIHFYMEHVAAEHNYTLTVSSYSGANAFTMLNALNSRQYCGAFIFSALIPLKDEYLRRLNKIAEGGMPVVLFMFAETDSEISPMITQILPSIRQAVCGAVDYLFDEKHHRRIAYLGDGDPEETLEQDNGEGLRVNGYQDSLRKHGLTPEKKYIFFLDALKYESRKYLNVEGVIDAYFRMEESQRPTAFYVNSDIMAAELIKGFFQRGVFVPDDLEVVGFGDTLSASIIVPELTTVRLPCKEIGEAAIDALMEKISGHATADQHFELALVKRASA